MGNTEIMILILFGIISIFINILIYWRYTVISRGKSTKKGSSEHFTTDAAQIIHDLTYRGQSTIIISRVDPTTVFIRKPVED